MKYLTVTCLSIILLGCATGKVIIPEIQNDFKINAEYDDVWSAVIETLAEMSAPIKSIEKESGLVTTDFVNFFSGYNQSAELDRIAEKPNYGILASWSRGRYKFNVFVRAKDDGQTAVKITTHIEAYENIINDDWFVCHSKGVIENELFESITSNLR